MRIQHNIMAMNAYRNYNNNTKALSKNLERLSSGYKINRAGDDAAGLAISEKMRAQITGLEAAQKNVKDGISLVNTAEGAMQEIHDMLNRMVYLATQSANGTYDNEVDRLNLQKEVDSLKSEINRIADSANFNGIKLLDGTLDANGTASITTSAPTIEPHAGVDGITIGEPENGGGSNGTYTISVDELFGNNDSLKITWGSGSGFVPTASATADNPASEGADATSALTSGGSSVTLNYKTSASAATDFEGTTVEEQAASIADALRNTANVTDQFDVTVEGNKVILTNKNEGNDQATVDKVEVLDTAGGTAKQAALDSTVGNTAAVAGTAGKFTFTNMLKTSGGMEFKIGDVLNFEITDANGNKWTAELEITKDILSTTDDATTHTNIKNALNETDAAKAVYFKPNDKTAAAEETIKFSDMFTAAVSTDGNSLELTAKDGGGVFANSSTATAKNVTTGKSISGTGSGTTAGTAQKYEAKLDTTTGDADFSIGDKLTIDGTLSDGRTFSIDLIAGTDFEIGAAHANTINNIVDALTKGKGTVDVTDTDGNVEQVAMNKIFSADANKNEIRVQNVSNTLTFTSQVEGDKFNGQVTDVSLDEAETGTLGSDLRNGVQKTAAASTLTFNSNLKLGDTATVNGTTYQFVSKAEDAEDGNTAVVIADPTDSAAVAKAFAAQLTSDADPAYTAKAVGDTVTITTTDKGKDVSAIEVKAAAASHDDVVFELQPNKLKTGSVISVNGQTFEFVDAKDAKDAKVGDGNIRIDIDLSEADEEVLKTAVNQAMVDAVNQANIPGVAEARLEDGKVKICGDDGAKVEVAFENGKALTLQIGDTSDSYNQLKVSVGDMHTWAMGIDGIDISSQEGAQAAIDVIRNAINYVSEVRGDLGAISNRLDHTANNLSVMAENIQDAESTIRDTDVAEEMMAYTKNNILVQSAQAMLAQANQVPQGVLQLLQ